MKPRIILVSALIIMPFSYSNHVVYPIIDPSRNKVTYFDKVVNSSSLTHSILSKFLSFMFIFYHILILCFRI